MKSEDSHVRSFKLPVQWSKGLPELHSSPILKSWEWGRTPVLHPNFLRLESAIVLQLFNIEARLDWVLKTIGFLRILSMSSTKSIYYTLPSFLCFSGILIDNSGWIWKWSWKTRSHGALCSGCHESSRETHQDWERKSQQLTRSGNKKIM